MDVLYKEESYQILGAAMEVYNTLGSGFLEAVYQEALEIELQIRKVPFERQKQLNITYKNVQLEKTYIADLLCYDSIIVELKAIKQLTSIEDSQVINYLKATKMSLGILLNFGSENKLQYKRLILTANTSHS